MAGILSIVLTITINPIGEWIEPRSWRFRRGRWARVTTGGAGFLVFLVLLVSQVSLAARPPAWRLELEEMGPVLKPNELPAVRGEVHAILEALTKQMVKIYHQREERKRIDEVQNELYLVNSTLPNAAVHLTSKMVAGRRYATNRFALTTGLLVFLRDEFSLDGVLDRERFSKALLGVLAHEVAHTLDELPSDAKHTREEWRPQTQQKKEAIADQDAILLLRESGFPPDALYVALSAIEKIEASETSARTQEHKPSSHLRQAARSHPEEELRQSLQRIGLTFGGMLFGKLNQVPRQPDEKFWQEITHLEAKDVKVRGLSPVAALLEYNTLEEVRAALENMPRQRRRIVRMSSLEFSHLVLRLAELMVARNGSPPDSEFLQWFAKFSLRMMDRSVGDYAHEQFPDKPLMWCLLTPYQKEFTKLHPLPAADLLAQSEWLNSAPGRELFRSAFVERFGADLEKVDFIGNLREMDRAGYMRIVMDESCCLPEESLMFKRGKFDPNVTMLPSGFLYEALKPEWHRLAQSAIDQPETDVERYVPEGYGRGPLLPPSKWAKFFGIVSLFDMPYQVELMRTFLPKLDLPPREIVNIFMGEYASGNFVLFRATDGEGNRVERTSRLHSYLDQQPDLRAMVVDLHRRNMGALAFAEILLGAEGEPIGEGHDYLDWRGLFTQMGISESEGYGQIRAELRKFTLTHDYYELAKQQNQRLGKMLEGTWSWRGIDRHYFSWFEMGLTEDLLGGRNSWLAADASLAREWARKISTALLLIRPQAYESIVKERLRQFLANQPNKVGIEEFLRWAFPENIEALMKLWREAQELSPTEIVAVNYFRDWAIEVIESGAYARDLKARWLETLLLADYRKWVRTPGAAHYYRKLETAGVITRPSLIFEKAKDLIVEVHESSSRASADYDVYAYLESELRHELTQISRLEEFEVFVSRLFAIMEGFSHGSSAAFLRLMNQATDWLDKYDPPVGKKFGLYQKITASGGTIQTDHFFRRALLPHLTELKIPRTQLETLIDRVRTQRLKLDLVRELLASTGLARFDGLQTPRGIAKFRAFLDGFVPIRTLERDELIEELAWSQHVNRRELLRQLEDAKTLGRVRKADSLAVNIASTFSSWISTFTAVEKLDFIRYISDPQPRDLPESLEIKITRLAKLRKEKLGQHETKIDNDRHRILETLWTVRNVSWLQKVPLIELLLSMGSQPLLQEPEFQTRTLNELLGLESAAGEGRALRAYLRTVPEYEVASSIAYLLARTSEGLDLGSGDLKDIFELFQVVGKKAGQAVNTWQLMAQSEGLRDLKDRAKPMSKYEIVKSVYEGLPPDEAQRIVAYERVLAAGSIKTITAVLLDNGQRAALATQGEYAARQVHGTIGLARSYLRELQSEGLVQSDLFIDSIAHSIEAQLMEELDLLTEAVKAAKAAEALQAVAQSFDLKGWEIRVPLPLAGFTPQSRVLVMEQVGGRAIDRLPDDVRREVGPILVEVYLRALFERGWIDADRSLANQLVDMETRSINVLDFGQSHHLQVDESGWRADDRTRVLNLLRASYFRDARLLVRSIGELLAPDSQLRWYKREGPAVARDLGRLFAEEEHLGNLLITLVKELETRGFKLEPKFSVYAMKGILTLYGEEYVESQDFAQILTKSAQALAQEKKSYLVMHDLGRKCSMLWGGN